MSRSHRDEPNLKYLLGSWHLMKNVEAILLLLLDLGRRGWEPGWEGQGGRSPLLEGREMEERRRWQASLDYRKGW